MLVYEQTAGCRMEYLAAALDDPNAAPCGRCDNCAGRWFSDGVEREQLDAAGQTLRRAGVVVEPRAQWPSGMDRLGVPVKGKIPAEQSCAEGRALARLTDLGWGGALREIFAEGAADAPISAELLQACVGVLKDWAGKGGPGRIFPQPAAQAATGRLPWCRFRPGPGRC